MIVTRRDILKSLGSAAAFYSLPDLFGFTNLAQAQSSDLGKQTAKFFVLIRMDGGWDVTLSMDPKIHEDGSTNKDMFIEYAPDEILIHRGLKLGPAISPLFKHKDDIAVINGILMNTSDNGHEASLNYLTTGNGEGKAPSLPVELAISTDSGPFGVVFHGEVQLVERKMMLSAVQDLLSLKDSVNLKLIQGVLGRLGKKTDFQKSLDQFLSNSEITDELVAQLIEREQLIQQASNNNEYYNKAALVLAAAFISGASNQGQIDINADLDSHSNHIGIHKNNQETAWRSVSDIFDIFKATPYGNSGESLFDRTTFAVISEFSRTPFLNSSDGKDHNPLTNSVVLAGRNIRGGQSVGASHLIKRSQAPYGEAQHVALPIDFKSGEVARSRKQGEDDNFDFITPDRVVATIAKAAGADPELFESTKINDKVLKTILGNG